METDNKNKQQIDIELSEKVAQGVYSNLAIITHSPTEFVVDFVRVMPNTPKAKVKSRIILTPEHAKRLVFALQENLKKYEQLHGKINSTENQNIIPLNFANPTAQA